MASYFTLVFLFLAMFCPIQFEEVYSFFLQRAFKRLMVDNVMPTSIPTITLGGDVTMCAVTCSQNVSCLGFNFGPQNNQAMMTCGMVSKKFQNVSGELSPLIGNVYYEEDCDAIIGQDYCKNGGTVSVISLTSHCSANCSCLIMFRGDYCEKACTYVQYNNSDMPFIGDLTPDGFGCDSNSVSSFLDDCALNEQCLSLVWDHRGSLCYYKTVNVITNPNDLIESDLHSFYSLNCIG